MSGYISEKDLYSLQRKEQELSELNHRTLENIQIEIKNIINLALNSYNPNKVVSALQAVESLSNTCNNDVRRYQDACKELINAEKEKCQNEINFVKQQQNDTDNSLERQILSKYITNRDINRKSYWKSFQYLANSDSMFVNKSPRNVTAAELLVTNIDSFQKQELRLQERISKLLNEMARTKNEKDNLEDSLSVLNSKLEAILIQKEDAEEETKLVKMKLGDFKRSYDDKLYEFKELENQLQDERTKCENLEQQCQELTQQIDDQHDVVVSNLNEQVRELTEQCQQYEKEKRKITLDYELSVQNYNSLVEKTDQDIAYKNK
jgi:chromosome segregation ATPase